MRKILFTLAALFFVAMGLIAQEKKETKEEKKDTTSTSKDYYRHEFSVNVGGGISLLQTKPSMGNDKIGATGTVGLGYHYFFCPNWAIGTGANFAVYNGGISIDDYQTVAKTSTGTSTVTTPTLFDFETTSSNYKDKQQVMMITIPLMVQYQATGKVPFYGALGGKVGIPLSGKSVQEGNFTTAGHFDPLSYPVFYENIPDYGFVTDQEFPENKTDLNLKPAFMLSAEAGMKWGLKNNMSLYTGIYFDYGLNNISKDKTNNSKNLVTYQPDAPGDFVYSTGYQSYQKQIAPLVIGVTLRLSLGNKKITKEEQDKKKAEKEKAKKEKEEQKEKEKRDKAAAEEAEKNKNAADKNVKDSGAKPVQKEQQLKGTSSSLLPPLQNFIEGQSTLTPEQKTELNKRVAVLKKYPEMKVHLYGHTCNHGGDNINELLGFKRAQTVKDYLVQHGIEKSRILEIASRDKSEPLVPNTSEANRKLNRRVEFRVDKEPQVKTTPQKNTNTKGNNTKK